MRKILMRDYGSEDVLFEVNENIPSITANQLLIKMVATSVNHIDVVMRKGGMQATMPPELQPKFPHLLGQDFSGIVTQIGETVTKFQVGDYVTGVTLTGTYSEYIAVDESSFVAKVPSDIDLVPLGGLGVVTCTAWSAVIGHGQVKPNQRVLIHGGAGGVGSMAIQLAKNAGVYVITTATESNKDFLKELGADEIVDYTTVNFEEVLQDIDLVIDTIGGTTQEKSYRVMKPAGKMFSTAGVPDQKKAVEYGVEAQFIRGDIRPETLHSIVSLYTDKKLKIHVDKIYHFTLDDIKNSHKDFENGPNRGKRIISFSM
ncbi:zinc-containing alcohol dehydrogenase [Gottschalkia acidurici 9a]|uniref:Zinc-containing alcohol dehydrogenase n=1 Tax=Gottschalkia acidurici (strain ATCC 7906 / DSM 604 / BCRC 14475 / CIP 104303 / KCTC 5404 / NCIMB 10678 / 9a) TaxID=1128398 RepID=K0B0D5_GOTA9|nr:NADP-dependent oxidoreductase [Gottschalkia acidurici]AFS78522.1 zinc-containing alcohol dehydrogenase [Gottschalkia acidurici 9a]